MSKMLTGFYLTLIMHGIVFGVNDGFYAIFVVEELKISAAWWGNIFTISTVAFMTLNILVGVGHKYIGSMNIIIILSALFTIKLIVVPFLDPYEDGDIPVVPILLSLLNTSPSTYVGVVGYVPKIAPNHLRAAVLGMCTTSIFVLGKGIGALISGIVSDHLGVRMTLKIFGFSSMGYFLFYFILYHCVIKHKESTMENNKDDTPLENQVTYIANSENGFNNTPQAPIEESKAQHVTGTNFVHKLDLDKKNDQLYNTYF